MGRRVSLSLGLKGFPIYRIKARTKAECRLEMSKIFITGCAGFIGFHLASVLLKQGHQILGYDGMTDYYDVNLKRNRLKLLSENNGFRIVEGMIENQELLYDTMRKFQPDVIVHLAAQAGVRYSLENPRAYIESNVVGTFNVMEMAREIQVRHLLMASTSSVYGANTDMPYAEVHKADMPLTIYAATKKANEAMGHSYAHLHKLPTTMFRFFTVYGPWGRPDMAPIKFAKGIFEGRAIDIYNQGNMWRDFTYVEDLVRGISLLIDVPPPLVETRNDSAAIQGDSLSPVAPYRIVNIGNSDKVKLMDFIEALETSIGRPAVRNMMEMQKGDVPATWADADLLTALTGYKPETDFREGVNRFIAWYRDYYRVQ